MNKVSVGKPEGETALGRPGTDRQTDRQGITMDRKEPGWAGTDCIHLAQDRPPGGTVQHGNSLLNCLIKCGEPEWFNFLASQKGL
jgi:hypothetical protein